MKVKFAMHYIRGSSEMIGRRRVKQDLYSEEDKSLQAWSTYVKRLGGKAGACIDEQLQERCVWVQDCGPVGMLCLRQRYGAQTAD